MAGRWLSGAINEDINLKLTQALGDKDIFINM
jgi:hypothetical protein